MAGITQPQAKVFFANVGSCCPFCSSNDIRHFGVDFTNAGVVYRQASCPCGETWESSYELVGVAAHIPTTKPAVEGMEPGKWFYKDEANKPNG